MPFRRNIRLDVAAMIVFTTAGLLTASLATYDRADRSTALGWLSPPDELLWPPNERPTNACGSLGAAVSDLLYTSIGLGAWFVVVGLVALAYALAARKVDSAIWLRVAGWLLALVGLTALAQIVAPAATFGPVIGSGGYLGTLVGGLVQLQFATAGSLILATAALLIGLFVWSDYWFFNWGWRATRQVGKGAAYVLPLERVGRAIGGRRDGAATQGRSRGALDPSADGSGQLGPAITRRSGRDDLDPVLAVDESRRPWSVRPRPSADLAESGSQSLEESQDLDDVDADEPTGGPLVDAPRRGLLGKLAGRLAGRRGATALDEEPGDGPGDESEVVGGDVSEDGSSSAARRKSASPATSPPRDERAAVIERLDQAAELRQSEDYQLPSTDILLPPEAVAGDDSRRQVIRQGKLLEKTFAEFGYQVKVVDVETGPVIAQYEIQLEAGLRLSKIVGLADDLAIALRVPSVRIVAPIPGKNSVGIEVPNESRRVVRLREVMENCRERSRRMKIPLFLGADVVGDPLVVDLASLPHLLIAGRTGTGKSVCLNAIISSILMTRRPDEVRMLMIDPKMVELSGYGRLPHLMHPVVTDMRKAEAILAWAVEKMEQRYALLARAGVRHITSYNQLGEEELYERLQPADDAERESIPTSLPFIVIVADEMADLMMTAGKEVEQHIIRLAQKSRAVGIHLILATQKPTVDVITGLIKSNLPARICFQVASRTDSRVVLDEMGAERLLGNGDLLFLWPGTSAILRGQGTYLSDDEIRLVTEAASTGPQHFVSELVNMRVRQPGETDESRAAGANTHGDELYHDAVEIVIREGRGSVSLLQRALGIGYGRAARLVDFMAEDGVVGPYMGSKSREVIMTLDQFHKRNAGHDGAPSTELAARDPGSATLRGEPPHEKRAPEPVRPARFQPQLPSRQRPAFSPSAAPQPRSNAAANAPTPQGGRATLDDDWAGADESVVHDTRSIIPLRSITEREVDDDRLADHDDDFSDLEWGRQPAATRTARSDRPLLDEKDAQNEADEDWSRDWDE